MTAPPEPDRPAGPPRPIEERPRPATGVRRTARNAMLAGASLVWLVPILALVVTLGLAWNSYAKRGDLIEVAFADAAGVTPGETVLKFREVTVGRVESVRFAADLTQVILGIRVDKDVASYIDRDAQFWVVRPEVSAAGISRLDTVLTGVFVEGDWDAVIGPPPEGAFQGLDRPPLTRANQPGVWVVLASDSAKGLSNGAPVMYNGVAVGRMENLRLGEGDQGVIADVFIGAPHDQRLTTATVFWNTAGLSLSLGSQGLSLDVDSLSSLLQGGVQFETLTSGGQPVEPGHVFRLQPDEDTARSSLFTEGEQGELRLTVLVDNAVRGLAKGADVQFQGLTVGRVTDLKLRVIEAGAGRPRQVVQDVTIAVLPQRMGLSAEATAEDALAFLTQRVADGLRARVASAGFLGTSLLIELVDIPNAAPARLAVDAAPHPILPSVEGDITDFTATAQGFISKIGQLPLEETLRSAQDMMNSVTALVSSEEVRAIPQDARAAIVEAQGTLADIRGLATRLRDGGTLADLEATTAEARELATRLTAATERLPELVASLDQAAQGVGEVDFAAIGAELSAGLSELRDIIGTDAAAELPQRLTGLLENLDGLSRQVSDLAGELQASGAMARAGGAVDRVAEAAAGVRDAVAGVPQVVANIDRVAQGAAAVDLKALGDAATGAAAGLRDVVATDAAKALPGRVGEALATLQATATELQAATAELRASGATDKLATALDEAQAAMAAVRVAAADVPAMVEQVDSAAAAVEEFDFAGISAQAEGIVSDLRGMLSTEEARALPKNLSDTLQAAAGLLNDLRGGNAVGSLNAALASARTAADNISTAVARLPQLAARYEQLGARAEGVIAAYGDRSAFNTEAINVMRELRRAAAAFGALADSIQRNPRAFILGR